MTTNDEFFREVMAELERLNSAVNRALAEVKKDWADWEQVNRRS